MKVKHLKELLETVNPELDVYVWDAFSERYQEATFAGCDELQKMDGDEYVCDEDDEPIEFETFIVSY